MRSRCTATAPGVGLSTPLGFIKLHLHAVRVIIGGEREGESSVWIALWIVLSVAVLASIGAAILALWVVGSEEDRKTRRKAVWKHLRAYGNWYLAAVAWTIAWVLIWHNNVPVKEEGVPPGKGSLVYEPALVALSLGLIAILVFAQIYDKEKQDRMRAAIAATFIFIFLFLVVDLLTIRAFREALADISDVRVEVTTENGLVVSTSLAEGECPPDESVVASDDAPGGGNVPDETTTCVPLANPGAATFVEGLFGTFKWALTAIIAFYFLAGAIEKASDDKTEREKEKTKQEEEKTNQERLQRDTPPEVG
jgi:hypothetical protein